MSSKSKFGFDPIEPTNKSSPRKRSPGPMGTAVREVASSLQESTEAKVEQRRQNANDAKEFRAAQQEGRVLVHLPLDSISADDLPRDRMALDRVAASDEMDELVASIRKRGQQEPIVVYRDEEGVCQLKKGWRRLTALKLLLNETGEEQFANVIARISDRNDDRLTLYTDMVEENIIREDLTFAEMANLAITAAADDALDTVTADEMAGKLYASLHKMKRSYIRSFIYLLQELGEGLRWPKDVSRNLGVEVSRHLKAGGDKTGLLKSLGDCQSAPQQNDILTMFVNAAPPKDVKNTTNAREKFEFHIGKTKVTARSGECRIVDANDYTQVPKDRLERAVRAFQEVLEQNGNPRVTTL